MIAFWQNREIPTSLTRLDFASKARIADRAQRLAQTNSGLGSVRGDRIFWSPLRTEHAQILTDTQRVILAHAAARNDRRVLPVPTTLNKNAGAIALCLRATLTSGLIAEMPAAAGDVRWRTDDSDQPTTLVVSNFGLEAIGIPADEESTQTLPWSAPAATAPKTGSKLDLLITRLGQPDGATIDELVAVTGWQKHSVRGAMSGALKAKRKLDVTSEMIEGKGRVYRIRPQAHPDNIGAMASDHQ